MDKPPLRLYVKPWCPWCVMAVRWLRKRGIAFEEIDVTADPEAYREMVRVSGQSRAPSAVLGGDVLPDFGPPELEAFLREHGYEWGEDEDSGN